MNREAITRPPIPGLDSKSSLRSCQPPDASSTLRRGVESPHKNYQRRTSPLHPTIARRVSSRLMKSLAPTSSNLLHTSKTAPLKAVWTLNKIQNIRNTLIDWLLRLQWILDTLRVSKSKSPRTGPLPVRLQVHLLGKRTRTTRRQWLFQDSTDHQRTTSSLSCLRVCGSTTARSRTCHSKDQTY